MIRSLQCWLALASTAVLTASAKNYTVSLDERNAAFPGTPGVALHAKRCAGPGCAAYPIDLSSSIPYVRFVLKATEADGAEGLKGNPLMLTINNCQTDKKLGTADTGLRYRNGKNIPNGSTTYVQQCQSFLLREIHGTGKAQTFAIGVSNTTVFQGWHLVDSTPQFKWLDPLFTPEQRFTLECGKTRKKGETGKYLAESCMIHMSTGDCLGSEPIGPNAEHGYVGQGSCNAEPVLMLWNILDVSSEFATQPTYTYPYDP